MDATRGVTNAVLLAVTLAIFNALSKKASNLAGLNGAVIFYSAVCIVMGIGLYFVLDEKKLQTGAMVTMLAQYVRPVACVSAAWQQTRLEEQT